VGAFTLCRSGRGRLREVPLMNGGGNGGSARRLRAGDLSTA
jgi:hypothetical protein